MKTLYFILLTLTVLGCATTDQQVKDTLKKNPQIVFDVIEDNPEAFIQSINKAAQAVQMKQFEKQMAEV